MFKKISLTMLAASMLVLPNFSSSSFAADIPITIDSGILKNNRVLIPLRAVSENLGADVKWDQQQKTITITKENTEMVLTINSNKVMLNQSEILLDVPAELNYNSTYVPARFVSQTLGADVNWNQQASQATITLDGKQLQVTIQKPQVQIPNAKKITDKQRQVFVNKLNEATDLSSIKQIRATFSPYFTDKFINEIIRSKGLKYDFKFTTVYQSAISYTNTNTAKLSQSSGPDSKYAPNETLYRTAKLVYTSKGWKVDGVDFSLVKEVLNP
ncbi:stalk domain-containing protein [Paenibacillus taichungensis]|uniref:stalk domain-containing protein n=1 Tax=Paenibacillus TaxID=44249 RepID=UPI00237BA789|nr:MULTISPECIES: stalk domain-containing protein [Paenibacillus]MEC0106954.1 stalk domain-containing protein [Paenibacillus taichungensis]MEC0195116.1 stalk domain-containing protein [Paenibacillus taichungensis]WDQ35114.1 stalk domain-containing protein [Paenibacillus marchantiae]